VPHPLVVVDAERFHHIKDGSGDNLFELFLTHPVFVEAPPLLGLGEFGMPRAGDSGLGCAETLTADRLSANRRSVGEALNHRSGAHAAETHWKVL
jgi:hypothetical protein